MRKALDFLKVFFSIIIFHLQGHLSFWVPHSSHGQSFTEHAEGKLPLPRDFFFFLLEKHDVTLLYTHCRRTLPWARGSPATAQVSRRLEADRSGLERRE